MGREIPPTIPARGFWPQGKDKSQEIQRRPRIERSNGVIRSTKCASIRPTAPGFYGPF